LSKEEVSLFPPFFILISNSFSFSIRSRELYTLVVMFLCNYIAVECLCNYCILLHQLIPSPIYVTLDSVSLKICSMINNKKC
jgi:hypothetical protein